MATLKELTNSIPQTWIDRETTRNLAARIACTQLKRMERLANEDRCFDKCTTRRPSKRRVENTVSSETMGTIGTMTARVRTGNYTGVVCKSRKRF